MEWGKKSILRELAELKMERLTNKKRLRSKEGWQEEKDLWVNQGIN